jgi:transposase InsO family protein
LGRALAFFARHGVSVERVLTDNGSPYRSAIHAIACRTLGVRHLRTRPRRPQTNGNAERFIRTLLAGRAYGALYGTDRERTAALDGWLYRYNHHRRHAAIGRQPPITRLNNLLGSYTPTEARAIFSVEAVAAGVFGTNPERDTKMPPPRTTGARERREKLPLCRDFPESG